MRAQASLLGEKTNQQVIADVKNLSGNSEQFAWSFQLVSPALGNYRYELFRAYHSITLYPVTVSAEGKLSTTAPSEEAFKGVLRNILSSDETRRIVHSLLAQAAS
jgi:hypothetical protein